MQIISPPFIGGLGQSVISDTTHVSRDKSTVYDGRDEFRIVSQTGPLHFFVTMSTYIIK